jgi:hypothetical protein
MREVELAAAAGGRGGGSPRAGRGEAGEGVALGAGGQDSGRAGSGGDGRRYLRLAKGYLH